MLDDQRERTKTDLWRHRITFVATLDKHVSTMQVHLRPVVHVGYVVLLSTMLDIVLKTCTRHLYPEAKTE